MGKRQTTTRMVAIMRNNPDDLANQILEKVKDMLEINTRVNWDSAEIEPNEEFQNILDEIKKLEDEDEF
jgi:hypothetical protein